jgi:hypothetical protein
MDKTNVVGKLYMVGCGHCDALVEPWNEMKKKVGGKVMVAEDIEAEQHNKLDELNEKHRSKVEVQDGYPTIYKIKKGGNVEYYNGERTASKLIEWALQNNEETLKHGGNKKRESNKKRKSNKKRGSRRNRTIKK